LNASLRQPPEKSLLGSAENPTNYSVCLYHSGLAPALERFVQRVWPKDSSTRFQASASEPPSSPIFLFLKGPEVIGHIATVPVWLHSPSGNHMAYWVVGFMVLPEYRNGPIGPLLIKKVNETLDCALTLHVEDAPLKIFKGLGWKHAGVIPQYVLVCDTYAFLKNIRLGQVPRLRDRNGTGSTLLSAMLARPPVRLVVAFLASIALKVFSLAAAILKPARGSGTVTEESGFDESYNLLWEKVARKYDALVVRNRSYLEFRYGTRMRNYRLLAYREKGELLGYCIVKMKQFTDDPRMGRMRVGTIVDCLFDPADLRGLQSLLTDAMRLCKREAVETIFCTASYAPLRRLLRVNGFIEIPGNLNFAYLDKMKSVQPDISLDSWHLMRGDSDADANF
jgi:Acetyltransferase (GNAT) family